MSRRILEQARLQQEELGDDDDDDDDDDDVGAVSGKVEDFNFDENIAVQGFNEDDSQADNDDKWVDVEEQDQFTAEDEQAIAAFMRGGAHAQRKTIADLIMEKLQNHEKRVADGVSVTTANTANRVRVDPKLVACYRGVGRMLRVYRSGKLPKAFKIIPALGNWEEVLYHTDPDRWSPNSLRHATRLFASNLNPKMAQRFFNLVLLPRVRIEIVEKKKLHWSIYQSLRKACYKPAAFYKGIILPMCEAGDCTLREATIVGSVIRHVSLPVLHSAVALLKIAQMPYSGANSIFMRIIIEKKYALPYRVLDGVVNHFCSFVGDHRKLPVLWHHCLLSFAQRYHTDLSAEQLEMLKGLLRVHHHDMITPEIRNQLFAAKPASSVHAADVVMTAVPAQDVLAME